MSVPIEERFFDKFVRDSESGCWVWTAAIDQNGYGRISAKGRRNCHAHRISWEIHYGDIPEGLNVCHRCDNPPCVNPDHLFIGSDRDNLIDSIQKGRRKYPIGSGMIWRTVRKSNEPKSKCVHGHVLNDANLYVTPQGLNACKECRRTNVRKWRMSH